MQTYSIVIDEKNNAWIKYNSGTDIYVQIIVDCGWLLWI